MAPAVFVSPAGALPTVDLLPLPVFSTPAPLVALFSAALVAFWVPDLGFFVTSGSGKLDVALPRVADRVVDRVDDDEASPAAPVLSAFFAVAAFFAFPDVLAGFVPLTEPVRSRRGLLSGLFRTSADSF